ncbi:WxL domain-containing protein [Enterococcus sp. AZ109]|uniref:WxL domain-containing protein n=1 Tax=Enterococcus sp. AZ109 TaxID=2774634 RepID=UPI003F27175F
MKRLNSMKLIRLATVATLGSSLVAGSVSTFAAENRTGTTDNEVTFIEGDDGGGGTVEPPVEPPIEPIDPIDPIDPGADGPLNLMYVPKKMDFGSVGISATDAVYNMIAEEITGSGGTVSAPYVSFAQVKDTRGTHEGWDLKVELSNFTTGSGASAKTLAGAQVKLSDPVIDHAGTSAPTASTVTIEPGSKVSVMSAADGQGAGTSSVIWGDQTQLTDDAADPDIDVVENEAIQLLVPASATPEAAKYTATMTWELSSTAGVGGETLPQ